MDYETIEKNAYFNINKLKSYTPLFIYHNNRPRKLVGIIDKQSIIDKVDKYITKRKNKEGQRSHAIDLVPILTFQSEVTVDRSFHFVKAVCDHFNNTKSNHLLFCNLFCYKTANGKFCSFTKLFDNDIRKGKKQISLEDCDIPKRASRDYLISLGYNGVVCNNLKLSNNTFTKNTKVDTTTTTDIIYVSSDDDDNNNNENNNDNDNNNVDKNHLNIANTTTTLTSTTVPALTMIGMNNNNNTKHSLHNNISKNNTNNSYNNNINKSNSSISVVSGIINNNNNVSGGGGGTSVSNGIRKQKKIKKIKNKQWKQLDNYKEEDNLFNKKENNNSLLNREDNKANKNCTTITNVAKANVYEMTSPQLIYYLKRVRDNRLLNVDEEQFDLLVTFLHKEEIDGEVFMNLTTDKMIKNAKFTFGLAEKVEIFINKLNKQ
ncbi:hypothetical protein ABK040_016250 [Willaertia magna]